MVSLATSSIIMAPRMEVGTWRTSRSKSLGVTLTMMTRLRTRRLRWVLLLTSIFEDSHGLSGISLRLCTIMFF